VPPFARQNAENSEAVAEPASTPSFTAVRLWLLHGPRFGKRVDWMQTR
jgi:hypothetical protein